MALRIDIKGHINDLRAKLARAKSGIRNFASSVTARLGGVAAAFAGAFAVHRIISGIRSLINEMDEIGKKSKALGVGVETFQEMSFAAKIAGVSMQQLSKGMGAMASFMLMAANNGKTQLAILDKLGLKYDDLAKMKPEEAFRRITKAIDEVGSAQERVGISKQIFGRAGVDLLNVARGYESAVQSIRNAGGIITEEDIRNAERFNDELALAGQKFKAGVAKSGFTTLLADLADRFNKEGLFDFDKSLKRGVLTPLADVADEINEKFGKAITPEEVAAKRKSAAETKAAKTLKQAFDEVSTSAKSAQKADRLKVDQFRRIGATAFGNQMANTSVEARLMEMEMWMRLVAESTQGINRKTPEVNQGGKF